MKIDIEICPNIVEILQRNKSQTITEELVLGLSIELQKVVSLLVLRAFEEGLSQGVVQGGQIERQKASMPVAEVSPVPAPEPVPGPAEMPPVYEASGTVR